MRRIVPAAIVAAMLFAGLLPGLARAEELFIDLAAVIDADASVASPGGVKAPAADGLAIANWAAAPQKDRAPGTYLLQFKQPIQAGTVIAYAKAAVSCQIGKTWQDAAYPGPAEHVLRFIPLPAGKSFSALRLTVEPELITGGDSAGLYGTRVPFLALLPQRLLNASPGAGVLTSSADAPSQGFQPVVWLNRPWTLVDGFISERSNFFSRKRAEGEPKISPESPEWMMLVWDRERPLRALLVARGSAEKGMGDAIVETYAGTGNPRFALETDGWQKVDAAFSQPMDFRSMQLLDFATPVRTRALRIRCVGGVDQVGIGELSALADLGAAAAPVFAEQGGGLKEIPFTIPGPGKVTIQVRDPEGNVVVIHLDPNALGKTTGDVGRVLSDQTGSLRTRRSDERLL